MYIRRSSLPLNSQAKLRGTNIGQAEDLWAKECTLGSYGVTFYSTTKVKATDYSHLSIELIKDAITFTLNDVNFSNTFIGDSASSTQIV